VVFPEQANRAVIDLDIRTRPLAYGVLQAALANADMSVTPPFTLTQGGGGIVACLPLTSEGKPQGQIDLLFPLDVLVDHVYTDQIAARENGEHQLLMYKETMRLKVEEELNLAI
jgi:sensor domain CHASE-containing protein